MVVEAMAGAEDTIYLCNFRVSVDGDWLCLKELAEGGINSSQDPGTTASNESSSCVRHQRSSSISPPETPPSGVLPPPGSRMHACSDPTSPILGGLEGAARGRDRVSTLLPPSLFAPYAPLCYERDPVCIERSNLVNISKLVVKELIESSLKYGRMLDSDSVPLQHFFIVLEHVLRHGLKPKRGILGPKKELWDLFQMVEKWTYEAQDITASVRDLPTVNTHIGRARAWLRLALMQKKLPDYFRLLLEHRDDLLTDFYEPGSLMLSDEAIVIMGLLVGLNVIDCNLCVKEEDLDSQMGVIDFSLYLRTSVCEVNIPGPHPPESADMTTVLDQKNYIEELNRHLNATVTNLQAKSEALTTTNASYEGRSRHC
ncbi:Protein RUFY3 [Armadillidium nasatum]|uniref:Protein RUFY3 n=1 Tax=Armadillidium nasatum TaxID=96803 RepID=A0A5N5T5C4_9CRUS|nr:Protein RUFY3 [Armadillidium nasatum]